MAPSTTHQLKKRSGGMRGTCVAAVLLAISIALSYNSPKSLYSTQEDAARKSLSWQQRRRQQLHDNLGQPLMTDTARRYFENKNKTIAYITYGHFTPDSVWRFQAFVLDALTTWLRDDIIYFVLNSQWRADFDLECALPEHVLTCQRVVPIYVNCTEAHYGGSPCCKMDQGMTLFWKLYSGHYDWFSYQDDDMYVKTAYLNDFVKGLSPRDPVTLGCKNTRVLGYKNDCLEGNPDFLHTWGQPVIYSRAALRLVAPALALGAVTKQGAEFRVTHDIANPMVHWMHGIPNINLDTQCEFRVPARFDAPIFKELMIVHGIGRLSQERQPTHSVFMDEVHRVFGSMPYPPPPYKYSVNKPRGFLQTQTYHLYGNVSSWTKEWHTFPVSDCQNITHPLGTPSLAKT